MKYPMILKFLLFPYILLASNADWKTTYTPINEKISNHSIKANFKSTGNYSGDCVVLHLENNTNTEQKLLLEAGDKLMCEDEAMQNIFVTQTQYIVLAPLSKKQTKVTGFCCASSKSAPELDIAFRHTRDTVSKELILAKYLNTHPQLDLHAVQHAVWVVCNGANIDGIYADDMASVQELKKTVSEITGLPVPWYTKKYDVDSAGRLQMTTSKLIAIMDFNLAKETAVTVQICNAHEEILKVPMQERMLQRGHYDYQFTWETSFLPAGKYLARVFSEGQLIQEREIML
jgi:hypothetical protein